MSDFRIMVATSDQLFSKVRYYTDVNLDVEMSMPQYKRIEIPRELALHINHMQDEIIQLKRKLKAALQETER